MRTAEDYRAIAIEASWQQGISARTRYVAAERLVALTSADRSLETWLRIKFYEGVLTELERAVGVPEALSSLRTDQVESELDARVEFMIAEQMASIERQMASGSLGNRSLEEIAAEFFANS